MRGGIAMMAGGLLLASVAFMGGDGFGRMSYDIEDAAQRQQIRDFVSGLSQSNTLGRVVISDEVEFRITREPDHVAIDWAGKIEASLPGIDPDLLRARLYTDHADVDMRVSGLRVNY
jgi:hypothetical protein